MNYVSVSPNSAANDGPNIYISTNSGYCVKCQTCYQGVHICPCDHGPCPTCGRCRCCNA